MALVDVIKSSLDSIFQISEYIEGATLYLDAGCTESFQLLGAFPALLELGVCAVCSLENICPLDVVADWNSKNEPAGKIVVMTSRLLSDAHRYILRCLSMHQSVRSCAIFTSIPEGAHSAYPESPLGPDAFHEYEYLLIQDFEELIKKGETKCKSPKDGSVQENVRTEDEGWSQVTSIEEDIPHLEASSSPRGLYGNKSLVHRGNVEHKLIVSVHHFPLILCPLSPRVFVLPSEGSVSEAYLSAEHEDSLSPGLPPMNTGMSYGDDIPPGATLTAHFLYHFAAKMDLKLEIFSLGDLSKTVGKMMTDMSSLYDVGRRKQSAGLLLIDRTLDLVTPCCHGDSLVDRMLSCLPRGPRTSSIKGSLAQTSRHGHACLQRPSLKVMVPIAEILGEEDPITDQFQLVQSVEAFLRGWNSSISDSKIEDLVNLSGKISEENSLRAEVDLLNASFVSSENFFGTPYLEALLERGTKDGAILVKKWLQETLRRENKIVNVKNRVGNITRSELQPMIKILAKSQSSLMRNKGIIQLAAATLYAVDELNCTRWDAFASAEKILMASAGDTSQNLSAQIGDLINKSALVGPDRQKNGNTRSPHGLLSLQDALLLTIVGYILAGENFPTSGSGGPFSWQEEHFLKEAIVDVVLENPEAAKLQFLRGLTEELEERLKKKKQLAETNDDSPTQLQLDDFDDDQWGKWGDEEDADNDSKKDKDHAYDDMQLKLELRDRVDNLFKYLHKLSSLKQKNVISREGALGLDINFSSDPYPVKGSLHKLLTRVLGRYEVPGLEYHSSTVGRLFKSGFGRFGLAQAKPNLADQSAIIVFVIGGINGLEVLEAHEALSDSGRPNLELILGGTTFLTPEDMLEMLLGRSSFF